MIPTRLRPAALPAFAAALALLAACASAPAEPPVTQVAGSYSGSINAQGQTLFGNMTLTQDGTALGVEFSLPDIALAATGEGTASATGVRLEVPYTIMCPGTAVFTGSLEEDGRTLSGTLVATDCDGTTNGTFRFQRR
jgi:hypothetical protein